MVCAGSLTVFAAWALVAPGASGLSWLYLAISATTAVACAWQAKRGHRRERTAWMCMAAAIGCFTAGDLYWTLALAQLDAPPYPSLSDAGYLAFAPLVYAGVILLVRARFGRLPGHLCLDGVIAALAAGALGSALLFEAIVVETDGEPLAVATNLAYPLADVVVLAVIVGVLVAGGARAGGTWTVLAGGLAVFVLADTAYLYMVAEGTYVENTLHDAGWLVGHLCIAVAACRPAARTESDRLRRWGEVTVPGAGGATTLGLLVYDHFEPLGLVPFALAVTCGVLLTVRLLLSVRANVRLLETSRHQAATDVLTGLGNRRSLLADLDRELEWLAGDGLVLGLFDLDGFKLYNDSFGHPAGDALLARLGGRLADAMAGVGRAYRMGGDEFCILVHDSAGELGAILERASAALSERGERFKVTCSYGTVRLPDEAADGAEALRLADGRMYMHKSGGRPSAARQATSALLRALIERNDALGVHLYDVAGLAVATADALGLSNQQHEMVHVAAELHDIGKVAIPDSILEKPGPLDADEWAFMRRHTEIGERIIVAAHDLEPIAPIVRATHERHDGTGYPDGIAGDQIPVEARIVAVADAYDAMTTTRSYRGAMSHDEAIQELRRCAGTQFDAGVVEAFCSLFVAGSAGTRHAGRRAADLAAT